jgi:hypothetical protein
VAAGADRLAALIRHQLAIVDSVKALRHALGMASKEELTDRRNHCGQHHRVRPDIVKRSNGAQGFEVSLIERIVERTLGWFNRYDG